MCYPIKFQRMIMHYHQVFHIFPIQISITDGGVSHVSHIPDAPCWNMHTYIYPIFMAQFCR